MSAKRKSDAKPPASKRGRKKKVEDDFDSDSESDGENGQLDGASKKDIEVLIESTEDTKLPEELLKTFDREPGKMMVAGMVTWELTGRRDPKGKVTQVRPNLYTFHRFTDETVSELTMDSLYLFKKKKENIFNKNNCNFNFNWNLIAFTI